MLKTLRLTDFRSYTERVFQLGKQTVLVGPNGIGKTNALEAIFFLATTSSFRTSHEAALIREGQTVARIVGDELEAVLIKEGQRLRKRFRVRGVDRRLTEVPGELPVVLFSAEMMEVLSGSPADRRRMLNIAISQYEPHYAAQLLHYRELMRQRNALLQRLAKGKGEENELDYWDGELAKTGTVIMHERESYVVRLAESAQKAEEIFALTPLTVRYHPSVPNERSFTEALVGMRNQDIRYGVTTVGPHRDDMLFFLDGHSLQLYGSRGEWRRSLLTYQFSQLLLLQQLGKEPILLLDDVFSELDKRRRFELSEALLHYQVVVTTSDHRDLSPAVLEQAVVIELA